jgi:CDP-diacylglycerol---glycerol-3-phosphate 3-phosphatidyltransferase
VNLPNAITVGRIASTPLIAVLPFLDSWPLRLVAFVLYLAAAITDYYDGMLARTRGLVTDLGKQLDPLADKLLLVGTLVPMYLLAGSGRALSLASPHRTPLFPDAVGPMLREGATQATAAFPFLTPLGPVGFPLWMLVVVIGRELFMTIFRSAAARRGVIISAIGPAKWKTGFQSTWVGCAYFWFFAATLAARYRWDALPWRAFAWFNGICGTLSMAGAVFLTLYSLWLYMRRYGGLFVGGEGRVRG